jgi:hypothetical protein
MGLAQWLGDRMGPATTPALVERMMGAYGTRHLSLSDCGYLLGEHPLDVWCGGVLARDSTASWEHVLAASEPARRESQAWLFRAGSRHAQDLRLRIRIERDAFDRMTPYWRRLGYPFERLVPSYASAIGSSSDRPLALAELMGIIVGDGARTPARLVEGITIGEGTPYQTVFEPASNGRAEMVMRPEVARALRGALAGVVDHGTASRVRDVFVGPDGSPMEIGGKTGSGDNRYQTFSRGGGLKSSRAVSRTAAFAFYVGERHYGVITASVAGPEAANYKFTSALPLEVLKQLAPAIREHVMRQDGTPALAGAVLGSK